MIRHVARSDVPGVVVGVGSDVPEGPRRAIPPALRYKRRPLRSTSAGSTRTRAARSCSTSSSVQPHRARRPPPGARRQDNPADPQAPSDPPPRVSPRRAEVRRYRGGRPADHALVLREPLDGRARSLGYRQAGARQRAMRRAEGPGDPERRGAVLRELRRVRGNAPCHHVGADAAGGARAERPRVLRRPLRVARDRAEIPRHAGAPGAGAGSSPRRHGAAARVLRAAPPHAAARRGRGGSCSARARSCHEAAGRSPGARDARLRRRDRPRSARHPARPPRRGLRVRHLLRDRGSAPRGSARAITAISSRRARRTTCCCTTSRSAPRRPG